MSIVARLGPEPGSDEGAAAGGKRSLDGSKGQAKGGEEKEGTKKSKKGGADKASAAAAGPVKMMTFDEIMAKKRRELEGGAEGGDSEPPAKKQHVEPEEGAEAGSEGLEEASAEANVSEPAVYTVDQRVVGLWGDADAGYTPCVIPPPRCTPSAVSPR